MQDHASLSSHRGNSFWERSELWSDNVDVDVESKSLTCSLQVLESLKTMGWMYPGWAQKDFHIKAPKCQDSSESVPASPTAFCVILWRISRSSLCTNLCTYLLRLGLHMLFILLSNGRTILCGHTLGHFKICLHCLRCSLVSRLPYSVPCFVGRRCASWTHTSSDRDLDM